MKSIKFEDNISIHMAIFLFTHVPAQLMSADRSSRKFYTRLMYIRLKSFTRIFFFISFLKKGMDSRFFDLFDPPDNVFCADLDTNTISW